MKHGSLVTAISGIFVGTSMACANVPPSSAALPTDASAFACCTTEGKAIASRYRNTAISQRRFTHAELWTALEPVTKSSAVRVTDIGRSIQGRPIRAITFGHGPTTVLLWSQMHGDESTATMALTDLLGWMTAPTPEVAALRTRIADALTVVMVPMLNPDGAELFQRENAVGVDVNRDAARLATPEARTLKALRDSIKPAFGFNLHDQNGRILSGRAGKQVAIALLAPARNDAADYEGARANARLVASGLVSIIEREIPGRVAKYEDAFNPRAFGDLMQAWGTSTVLIESGALPDDPQKQKLREINVIGILSALQAIATERYRSADPRVYDNLAMNDRAAVDLMVKGAQVVLPGIEPMQVDLALNYGDLLNKLRPQVREVGDLSLVVAFDTLDARGLFLHPAPAMLTEDKGMRWLRIGATGSFTLRRTRDPNSEIVRTIGDAVGPRRP
ncbi:MAG: M14 family zinc carboxypeptidase [Gemmatimonadota bacterium]